MTLSDKAIQDLRQALKESYGATFDDAFSDNDLNELGELFLNTLAENLKMKVTKLH